MFLRNLQKEITRDKKGKPVRDEQGKIEYHFIDVGPITYEGFEFTLPANRVCAIWDDAGQMMVKNLFKIESREPGAGLPGVLPAERKEWDGHTVAHVSRYKVNHKLIGGRPQALKLAEKRDVPLETISLWKDDEDMTTEDIINEINKLPIPEEVRYPIKEYVDNDVHTDAHEESQGKKPFCEFCSSKGVKHKKECPKNSKNKEQQ